MIEKNIPEGKECHHSNCRSTCHVKSNAKPRKPLNRKTPIKKRFKAKEGANELNVFFNEMMAANEPVCSNCGNYRAHLKYLDNKFLWKSCQAHLLPKRLFKSLATNPLNILVLGSGLSGMCHCHDDYDSNFSKASQMQIWPTVIERFKLLYPSIDPSERKFIPDVLQEHIPK